MSKRAIITFISGILALLSLIVSLVEDKYKDEDMTEKINKAVEERLKHVAK